jgi:hypothetical protein
MAGDNSGSIPSELLENLKAATVFVKVENKDFRASGSGFLLKVQGNTAYVVTNAHVIDPKIEIEITVPGGNGPIAGMPQMPRFGPGGPMGPRGPMGMRGPPMFGPPGQSGQETRKVEISLGNATTNLVFRSGTKQEQSYRAVVVASDTKRDLAILKVTGLKEPPPPIDCSQSLKLQETMPVYILGFPFGEQVTFRKGSPEITIGKGSISAIRRDDRDQVAYVQIDGETFNPGNSGGPVVDSKWRLVGVAVMSHKSHRLHLAIPAEVLSAMLLNQRLALDNPLPAAGKIFESQPRVFLSDLEEFDVKSGLWPFTNKGRLGDPDDNIILINGYKSPKGLSMHPPEQDYSAASYRLGKQASLFRAEVALNDSSTPLSAAVFEVWGDGKRLWKSKSINQLMYSQRCRVDVSKVDVMELRVSSTGSPLGLHAVWYEPRLLEKANTPDK